MLVSLDFRGTSAFGLGIPPSFDFSTHAELSRSLLASKGPKEDLGMELKRAAFFNFEFEMFHPTPLVFDVWSTRIQGP